MARNKVLIVTHPVGLNYGGIIQAYALQRYIRNMGFDAETTSLRGMTGWKAHVRPWYFLLKRMIGLVYSSPRTLTPDLTARIGVKNEDFIKEHIKLVDGGFILQKATGEEWSAIVVGSDQVWRKAYVPIERYLLDFAEDWNLVRISYAASFGRDDLSEYSPELLTRSAELAQKFDAISVRETSGVELVRTHWQRDAELHLDPSMLFDAHHYRGLLKERGSFGVESKDFLFTYILDRDESKSRLIQEVVTQLGIHQFDLLPPDLTSRREFFAEPERFQLRAVTDWIRAFDEARFVVTDSFHGTAFSILFNKPFLVVGNPKRGLTRIHSILEKFGLQERLVESDTDVTEALLKAHINWEHVNANLESERSRSAEYLTRHLGSIRR